MGDRQRREKENKGEEKEENARARAGRSVAAGDSRYERNHARSIPVSTVRELIVELILINRGSILFPREIDKTRTLAKGYVSSAALSEISFVGN